MKDFRGRTLTPPEVHEYLDEWATTLIAEAAAFVTQLLLAQVDGEITQKQMRAILRRMAGE